MSGGGPGSDFVVYLTNVLYYMDPFALEKHVDCLYRLVEAGGMLIRLFGSSSDGMSEVTLDNTKGLRP